MEEGRQKRPRGNIHIGTDSARDTFYQAMEELEREKTELLKQQVRIAQDRWETEKKIMLERWEIEKRKLLKDL